MSLADLLSEPDVSPVELFQQPDILGQLRQKVQLFVDFCKRNEQFTRIMITLGIKTPNYQNEKSEMRQVSYIAIQILTCDNDAVADLFIMDSQRIRYYSQESDQITEEIVRSSDGEELTTTELRPAKSAQDLNTKYVHLLELFDFFASCSKYQDENCVNYFSKILHTLIRVKGESFFQFLLAQPQYLQQMITFMKYPSFAHALVRLINDVENPKYRPHKLQIVKMAIAELLKNVDNSDFCLYCQFVEEAFDKNRHRTEEQDEIKIVTQPLVDEEIINYMVQHALATQSSPVTKSNCLLYLLRVVERMNVDEENNYCYTEKDKTEQSPPTMNFHYQPIFGNIDGLISLADRITRPEFTRTQVLTYYELLSAISANRRFVQAKYDTQKGITCLLSVLNGAERGFHGLIKQRIVAIIEKYTQLMFETGCESLLPEFTAEISKFTACQGNETIFISSQGVCFSQKLQILLAPNNDSSVSQIQAKYCSVLVPSNYTEDKKYTVKELDFVRQPRKRDTQTKSTEVEAPSAPEQQKKEDEPKQIAKSEIVLNMNVLNSRIEAIKNKKGKQLEQQPSSQGEQKQPEQKLTPSQPPKMEKENQQPQRPLNPGIVNFYSKHLILF